MKKQQTFWKDPTTADPWEIREMPERERPAYRLDHYGADVLSDTEIITLLAGFTNLGTARQVVDVINNDLTKLLDIAASELAAIKGVGRAAANRLKAAAALAVRLSRSARPERPRLESPREAVELMRDYFAGKTREEFHVLHLDTKHRLLKDELVTIGLLDRSQVHARECFRSAIKENCSRIVLVHNHPSGDPTPSAQDISCTKNLIAAGKIIGIEILDHIIIGRRSADCYRDWLSLREENLI